MATGLIFTHSDRAAPGRLYRCTRKPTATSGCATAAAEAQRNRVPSAQAQVTNFDPRSQRRLVAGILGHEHLVTTSDIKGKIYIHPKLIHSGFDLRIPLKSLKVDQPAERRHAAPPFHQPLGPSVRTGTRQHMLGPRELDAKADRTLTLRSVAVAGPGSRPKIVVRVGLHDAYHEYTVPTTVVRSGQRLVAIGRLVVQQTDFGITPFSILAGGLRVADPLAVSFHIVAAPVAS